MRVIALLAVAPLACGDAPAMHGFASGPVTTLPADDSSGGGSTGTSTTGAASTGALASTGAATPDMGAPPPPDFGSDQPIGCKGKIDFVFVISRYWHMEPHQQRLLSSVPGFMATIAGEFPDFDTHIIVANPDGESPGYICHTPNCDVAGCTESSCSAPSQDPVCESTIGAGILFPTGELSSNRECELAGGNRYITRDEPDPVAAFECVATLGIFGGDPSPAEALVEVVSPAMNAPDGCNAGFLRSDALLVVTFISDVADVYYNSKDWPYEWYDDVVAAKHGDPDAVVVLSIIPPKFSGEPPLPDCLYDYSDPSLNRLYEFTEMFPHHVIASNCEDSYVPAFTAAAASVKDACAAFIPR
jgi:hypothetical protein